GATGEHLDDSAYLVISPDYGVQLALPRKGGQIPPVADESLVFSFRVGIGHALGATDELERREKLRGVAPVGAEESREAARCLHDGHEKVLGAHELVGELGSDFAGGLEDALKRGRRLGDGSRAGYLRSLAQQFPD